MYLLPASHCFRFCNTEITLNTDWLKAKWYPPLELGVCSVPTKAYGLYGGRSEYLNKDLGAIRKGEEGMDIRLADKNLFYSLTTESVVHGLALLASPGSLR